MLRSRRLLPVLVLLLALGAGILPCRAEGNLIRGGVGVGPVRLGQTMDELKKALGAPARTTPSPNDPDSKLLDYPARGLSIFMGSSGAVIGVVVSGTSWKTSEGIGVGSPQARVTELFGRGLQRGPENLTYPSRGLAFAFQGGKVRMVYVVQKEEERPLLGDRLVDPGRRVGDLRIGDPVSRVDEAWGRADKTLPLGKDRQLHVYKEEAVSLVVYGGRVEAIILETGDFITREGVKVGSTRAEVLKAFGRIYRTEPDRIWYDVRGIGFWFQGDRVRQIQVVAGKR